MKIATKVSMLSHIQLLQKLLENNSVSDDFTKEVYLIKKINVAVLSPFLKSFIKEYNFKYSKVLKKALLEIIKEPTILALSPYSFSKHMTKKLQLDFSSFSYFIRKATLENSCQDLRFINAYLRTINHCTELQTQAALHCIYNLFLEKVFNAKNE